MIFCSESGINAQDLIFHRALEFIGRVKLTVLDVSYWMYISWGGGKSLSVAEIREAEFLFWLCTNSINDLKQVTIFLWALVSSTVKLTVLLTSVFYVSIT